MNRNQKEALVSDLKDKFTNSQAAFLVNYKGLTVSELQNFRTSLREQDALFTVAKARLMKIAASEMEEASGFADSLKDQVGLVFAMKEAPATAKTVVKFAKDNESLDVVAGLFESKFISEEEVKVLATIPSREVLLAQLASVLQAPVAGLARTLNMTLAKLAYALQEVAKKKE